jgi:hypothetical protein
MRFYRLDEVPVSPDDMVFRQSSIRSAIVALVFLVSGIASITCAVLKWPHNSSVLFFYFFGGFLSLIGLAWIFNFRATLKPTNWLMRCQLSGCFLKYRAYENWRMPADSLQIVGFEYGEITWAKLVKERRKSPNTDGKGGFQIEWLTYIDLGMTNPDLSALEANLAEERKTRPTTGVNIVTMDYPVQVQPNGVVEIRWNAGLRPSAKKALEVLGRRVKILETEHRQTDLTHHFAANPEEDKAKILALAKSGDHFGAVKLAQQAFGYNLTQAHNYVDGVAPDGFDAQPPDRKP